LPTHCAVHRFIQTKKYVNPENKCCIDCVFEFVSFRLLGLVALWCVAIINTKMINTLYNIN